MATTTKPAAPADSAADARVDDLAQRVERLEKALEGLVTGKVAEISQEERDRRTLAKLPNSYAEAVEHEAAKERQAERDRKAKSGRGDPAEGEQG